MKLKAGSTYAPGSYFTNVSLDQRVNIGEYHATTNPDQPIVLTMHRFPCQPGLPSRVQHRAGRAQLYATPFDEFERNIRLQLARSLGSGGFDPANDIAAITVNRWPHGYAYQYNSLWDPFWLDGGPQPCVAARQPFGRIAIANADADAYAYTDCAIDQAYRAVSELKVGPKASAFSAELSAERWYAPDNTILNTRIDEYLPIRCKKGAHVGHRAIGPARLSTCRGPSRHDRLIGRSAVRKASWRLIPLIALGYGTAFMDRINISFASLQMNRDLHFSATVYGFGAGLFFVSYAACEVPSNLLLVRFGARRWLSRIMLTWGLLAIGMMFVKTAPQFYVMRFLLGMAEAGFFPGVVFYLMQWFPPEMRARAISRFYISLPLSSVVMGSIAGALLNLQGRLGLAGWQWLFLVEGLPAILLSVVFFLHCRTLLRTPNGLSPDEREWLLERIHVDTASGGHTHDVFARAA